MQSQPNAKKADVFAAGIIFLEILSLRGPSTLYDDLWPKILEANLPNFLWHCLTGMLEEEPIKRLYFSEQLILLNSKEAQDLTRAHDPTELENNQLIALAIGIKNLNNKAKSPPTLKTCPSSSV